MDLTGKRVMPQDLEAFCVRAMIRYGVSEEHARISAHVLTTVDTWGIHTHGTRQIFPLMKNVADGRIKTDTQPTIDAEGPGWVMIDAQQVLPMVSSTWAMDLAIQKAKTQGIAFAGVRHSSHFGAAGYYATMALQEDMIGLAMTNVDPWMTVPGARRPVLGTNPIAYAVPAGQERPVFLDIATSTVAVTKILSAKALGKKIPEGWLVDDDGLPTTDPSQFPEKGALMPMAGHKGYGLALMIEILSGVLTGSSIMDEIACWLGDIPQPADEGHAFIAINVGAMIPIEVFKARMDEMIRRIHAAPKAKGHDRVYLPGEMEWEKREMALQRGLQLPDYAITRLLELADATSLRSELEAIFR